MVETANSWEPPNQKYPPPKAGEPELHRAARLGDHDAIRRAVSAGNDIDQAFDLGLDPDARAYPATPLMVAAGSGEGATIETVNLLLELGADPGSELAGENALTFSCRGLGWNYRPGGDVDRLRALVQAGVRLPADRKMAARLVADLAGQGDAVRLRELLLLGAPVNSEWRPDDGQSAVQTLQHYLMSEGPMSPNPFSEISEDLQAEYRAVREEFERKDYARIASAPCAHEIPLFQAAASGDVDCVRLLLDQGADLLVRDNSSRTALFVANGEEVIRLLVERGLSTEDVDRFGWTPLTESGGNPSRMRALIAVGANVNAVHDRGYTVFMSAASAMERQVECLRLLIEAGADPRAVSDLGWNALHAAVDVSGEANAEDSVRGVLRYLHEVGVDLEQRNNRGQTPLARAIHEGSAQEVEVLCELGADVNALGSASACWAGHCATEVSPLIFTALGAPVDSDRKLAALLRAGASRDARNPQGQTPLQLARHKLQEIESGHQGAYDETHLREARSCVEILENFSEVV